MSELRDAFDRGAARYDLLVGLNPGYHAHLHSAAASLASRIPADGLILDLACGSGASTAALVAAAPGARQVLGVDLSDGMLERARSKPWPAKVSFQQGRVGDLDRERVGSGWDGVFASYLMRNVPAAERDAALREIHSLLAPGGWLVLQEYSVEGDRLATAVWDAVSWGVIIPLGIVIDRNPGLYRYLWRSVRDYDAKHVALERMARAGFVDLASRTVGGWQRGILHTFIGRRPL